MSEEDKEFHVPEIKRKSRSIPVSLISNENISKFSCEVILSDPVRKWILLSSHYLTFLFYYVQIFLLFRDQLCHRVPYKMLSYLISIFPFSTWKKFLQALFRWGKSECKSFISIGGVFYLATLSLISSWHPLVESIRLV